MVNNSDKQGSTKDLTLNLRNYVFSQCTIPSLLDFLAVLLHLVLAQDLETTHFQVSSVEMLLVIYGLNTHFISIDIKKIKLIHW